MLTIKQKKLFDFLNSYHSKYQIYPTFEEMKLNLNVKSKSGIHKLLSSLEEKGYIKRLPHKARALKLNNVITFKEKKNDRLIPFLGKIAAGNPISNASCAVET